MWFVIPAMYYYLPAPDPNHYSCLAQFPTSILRNGANGPHRQHPLQHTRSKPQTSHTYTPRLSFQTSFSSPETYTDFWVLKHERRMATAELWTHSHSMATGKLWTHSHSTANGEAWTHSYLSHFDTTDRSAPKLDRGTSGTTP